MNTYHNSLRAKVIEKAKTIREKGNFRYGQSLFLALHAIAPECAEILHSTDCDCFYDDKKVRAFLLSL